MNKKTVALSEEQYIQIIKTIRNGFVCADGHVVKPNERIATVLVLEANLGLRISDILQLRLSAVIRDGSRYRLDIVERKTGKKREFTVPVEIYSYIQNYALENGISPSVIARWLYMNGRTVRDFNMKLLFKDMKDFSEEYGFFCEKEPERRWSRNGRRSDGKDAIRDRINEEIRKQNIPKTEIAERCGFDRKILYGGFYISLPHFARLCTVLHVSAEYLLFGYEFSRDEAEDRKWHDRKVH